MMLSLLSSVCLLIGCGFGMHSNAKGEEKGQIIGVPDLKVLTAMLRISLVLTLIGYVTFVLAAYLRGASVTSFVAVIKGVSGASGDMKKTLFKTLPGVTTCTQFGIASALLIVFLARFQGWKSLRTPLVVLLGVTVIRAIFLSERLALIEVAIPTAVMALRLFTPELYAKEWRKRTLRFAPAGAPFLLYIFFALSEYFRSWTFYATHAGGTLWEFAFGRLTGYYLTSMNNSAYLLKTYNFHPWLPTFTCEWFFKFPFIGSYIEGGPAAILYRSNYYEALLTAGANPEFNNPGGIFSPMFDFGVIGGLAFWLFSGFLLGRIFGLFRRGQLVGLMFYPLGMLSLMEVPRILYWTAGRAFPTILFLTVTLLLIRKAERMPVSVGQSDWLRPDLGFAK
jgi:hypothetical protein